MPFTMNGVGTSVCKARGDVGWGSFDAVECFVVFFLPIFPLAPVHSFNWDGSNYQRLPLRWSVGVVVYAMLRRWLWGAIVGGAIVTFCAFPEFGKAGSSQGPLLLALGLALVALGVLLLVVLTALDRRTKDIRLALGVHGAGVSDPADWSEDLVRSLGPPQQVYGTEQFADAVGPLLEAGRFSQAMWAARLATALEHSDRGEELTDSVLHHAFVRYALEQVRRAPNLWEELMLCKEERGLGAGGGTEVVSALPPPAPMGGAGHAIKSGPVPGAGTSEISMQVPSDDQAIKPGPAPGP